MRKVKFLVLFFCAAIFFGCESSKVSEQKNSAEQNSSIKNSAPPEWISTPKKVYPSENYFSSVASAKSASQAEVAAMEGIASIFSQDVSSVSTISTRMQQAANDEKISVAKSENFSQDVSRSVDVDSIVGAEIKEYWTSGETVYAIAVMDKKKSSKLYAEMIATNNAEIERLMAAADSDGFTIESYARLDFAKEISVLNEKYLSRLSVVDFENYSSVKKNCVTSSEISEKILSTAKEIPFYVFIDGDEENRAAAAFSKSLNSFGFRTSAEKNCRYSFTGTLQKNEYVPKDKSSVQCKYFFKGEILDRTQNQNLMSYSFSGRGAGNTFSDAKIVSFRSIENKAEGEFTEKLADFLANIQVK
jgi:hypothetical protein